MKVLIAESKTMSDCLAPVSPESWKLHRPWLDSLATGFMRDWSEWQPAEVMATLKISAPMAAGFKRMAYEFSNKSTGCKAIEAYTGVVFKALDYASLSHDEQERADSIVGIISSLYGWLRGDDIIKPYRLDYTDRMAPGDLSMAAYWKPLITPLLLDSLQTRDEKELLDLLPGDASKCLDWRLIRRCVKVVKVVFKTVMDGGILKTPPATLLKTMRGQLLRDIIIMDIRTIDDLMSYSSASMCVDTESEPSRDSITLLSTT